MKKKIFPRILGAIALLAGAQVLAQVQLGVVKELPSAPEVRPELTIENERVLARFDGDMALIDYLCARAYPAHQEGNVQQCGQRARAAYVVRYLPDYVGQAKFVQPHN